MSVGENFANVYLRGMRDRSMRSGTKVAREIQLTDWSTAENLSNRPSGEPSGVQIPRDICTRFGRYLYSTKCSWIIFLFDICTRLNPPGCVKGLKTRQVRILGQENKSLIRCFGV